MGMQPLLTLVQSMPTDTVYLPLDRKKEAAKSSRNKASHLYKDISMLQYVVFDTIVKSIVIYKETGLVFTYSSKDPADL